MLTSAGGETLAVVNSEVALPGADATAERPSLRLVTDAATRRVAYALGAIITLGVVVRFGSLGIQSYHHDEVITAMRVIPGSFGEMLHKLKVSESNPPLYYVLAWGWAKVFGLEEVGLRSLSALFGAATVPVGYLIGRQLNGRRCGLILAGFVALNPMLIWYSQEARSYALLVFFAALSLLFFLRALESRGSGRDLALWAIFSALALCSHYFAVFPIAIEGAWLLLALKGRRQAVLAAGAAVAGTMLALLPLLLAQINPRHIGWIAEGSVWTRLGEAGIGFLAGETGHVIAEPPRPGYAVVPAIAVGAAIAMLVWRGDQRQRRGAVIALVVGFGVIALALLAAAAGKDYVIARNLLPALVPLAAVVALGFSAAPRRLSLLLAGGLCAYWLAFAVYVTQTPSLQRPDFRVVGQDLGRAQARRAIVSWRLAADPIRWYLPGKAVQTFSGLTALREVDIVSKPRAAGAAANLLPSFRAVERVRIGRLTLTRYRAPHLVNLSVKELKRLPTGFAANGVVLDRPPPSRGLRMAVASNQVAPRIGISQNQVAR
ncbi:MAG: glycosyltransferase family 39 protein [Actinobacteria bacterium]|nr:glycosyltransferase family 39 protein [Actinomycetota bacterium]